MGNVPTETMWLPLEKAAEKMKRNADRIRAQIRNDRLFRGQHYRLTKSGEIQLNVAAYLDWISTEKERRKLRLVERLELSHADSAAGWYGGQHTNSIRRFTRDSRDAPVPSLQRSQKLIPLSVWARQVFGEYAPPIRTLRIWSRNGKILPVPRKVGREFFCSPDARYVDALAERLDITYAIPKY